MDPRGVERQEKMCDAGKCDSAEEYKTEGEDATGLSAPKQIHFGTREGLRTQNAVPVDIPAKQFGEKSK